MKSEKMQQIESEYKQYILDHEEECRESGAAIKEYLDHSTAAYNGLVVHTLHIPKIFTEKEIEYFRWIVKTTYSILTKVIREYIDNPAYRKYFPFSKQLEELMKTHQTLEYITKLNKSLLLLSKIDNGQFTDTKELELNVLLKQYLQDYEEVYDYRNIEVTIDEQGVFKVTMNESLAVALLTNLLKNAFVHNIDGGHIRITVTKNGITFRNSGVEHPLNKEHIFERFYQGSKKEGSTGLGLAIADSICRLQHLNIKYYFEQNEHCFEISQS